MFTFFLSLFRNIHFKEKSKRKHGNSCTDNTNILSIAKTSHIEVYKCATDIAESVLVVVETK